ncbi:MAG: hypothetical protein ABI120_21755, partial [Gemmatimonadaceae bacterium]
GKPAPACRWFALAETVVDFRIHQKPIALTFINEEDGKLFTSEWRPVDVAATATVGVLRNVGRRHAVGAELTLWPGRDGPQYGVKARYRRWIGAHGVAFDASAGILEGSHRLTLNTKPKPGFSTDVALDFKGFVAVTTRVELLRGNGKPKPLVYAGVRAGSGPAFALAAAVANVFAIAWGFAQWT